MPGKLTVLLVRSRTIWPGREVPVIDLMDLDAFEAGRAWPMFDELRASEPLHWNDEAAPQHGFWSLTRHTDVVRVLRDPGTFSSQAGGANLEELDADQLEVRRSMLETDGERHRALRRLLQDEFTPKGLAGYEVFLRGLARATVDAALDKGSFDVVKDISADFPINVLARLLDVPADHTGQLIAWGNRMIGNSDPDYADVLVDSAESEQYRLLPFRSPAAAEVFAYGLELAGRRGGGNGTDLVSMLVNQVAQDGVPLDER